MKIVYKCKQSGIVKDSVDMNEFSGYRIQIDHDKISKISEFFKNNELARIIYRPTKTPLIQKVEYNGHVEERYNNNKVSSKYYMFDKKLYGEYLRYDIHGNLQSRKYFYEDKDITEEIMSFIGYKDSLIAFMFYSFREDEAFNIMIRYGNHFRFSYESNRDSSEFDEITKYCQIF